MTYRTKIAIASVLSIFLLAVCSKKEEKKTASQPATASGITDSLGTISLHIGSYIIDATVRDTAQTGLANMTVNGYLLKNRVLLTAYDSTGAHYPTVGLAGYSAMVRIDPYGPPDRIASFEGADEATIQVGLVMYSVQLAVYGFESEPAGFDDIVADEWTVENCHDGTLTGLWETVHSGSVYQGGVFIHLSSAVAQAISAPMRTAVFMPAIIDDYPLFSSLAGLVFRIFDGDTLHYCSSTYSGTLMPILNIDNVRQNRNFWYQFTLIWGENPHDLDSHLWTAPINDTTYHIYYIDMGYPDQAPFAQLDVDDVTSYGPEHMTIYQHFAGTYTYAVYHYSGSGTLATSGARVSLIKPDGTLQAFSVPTDTTGVGSNWWWHVCTIDGTTGVVTTINILSADPPIGFRTATNHAKPVDQ